MNKLSLGIIVFGSYVLTSCNPESKQQYNDYSSDTLQGSGYLVPVNNSLNYDSILLKKKDTSLNYDSILKSKGTLIIPSVRMIGDIDTSNLKKQREEFIKKIEGIVEE
ncbi:MAG: hypothetical protein ACP5N1_02685 [Candidatus Woesearchaeota archaeon]